MPAGSQSWGRFILCITFILMGILMVTSITFALSNVIIGLGLIAGGVLWAFGKP